MNYHDKAIKSMLDNLGLFTYDNGKGTSMNLSKYENVFDDVKRSKVGLLETLKDPDDVHSESDKFRVFRKNHFEVFLFNDNKAFTELRLATKSIKADLFSGNITQVVYATEPVLKCIAEELRPLQKLNLMYLLYTANCDNVFTVFDDKVTLEDISFSSDYDTTDGETNPQMVILKFKAKMQM